MTSEDLTTTLRLLGGFGNTAAGASMLRAADEIDRLSKRVADLEQQVEELRADAQRWRYIDAAHSRAHSPHMDGTFGWAFRGPVGGRFATFAEAIDAAMEAQCE